MKLDLEGKVAIVTGAGSQIGFGKYIALTLAREGCDIVAADVDFKGAKQTVFEIEALGYKAIALKADVTNCTELTLMVRKTLEKSRKIDILVNNAGVHSPLRPFAEKTKAESDFDIDINLKGTLNCTRAMIGHMLSCNTSEQNSCF